MMESRLIDAHIGCSRYVFVYLDCILYICIFLVLELFSLNGKPVDLTPFNAPGPMKGVHVKSELGRGT